jgi:hypothetical protein
MSEFKNLHRFIQTYGPVVAESDRARKIDKALSARSSGDFVLRSHSYGDIRAVDIYNHAYNRIQGNRSTICITAYTGMVGIGIATAIHVNQLSTQIGIRNIDGKTGVWSLVTGAALTLGCYIVSKVSEARASKSDKIYRRQFDAKTGTIQQAAPADKDVARKAEKFLCRYRKNKYFARSITFGEGLTDAEPIRSARLIHTIHGMHVRAGNFTR